MEKEKEKDSQLKSLLEGLIFCFMDKTLILGTK